MTAFRRPLLALAACAAMLPLAACYDDGYGPDRGYGPPPPPPPPGGYYRDQPPPPPPPPGGYYRDGAPPPPPGYADPRGGYDARRAPPPPGDGYDPRRDYREGGPERAMSRQDQVYQGGDGRYYCRRSDGTTGLVVGAIAGGVLGNIVGGHSLGTLLGAGGGALLGRSVDQGQVRCR